MLYQVTISTPDLSRFAELAVLLRNNGFENQAAPQITTLSAPVEAEPVEKKARKPRADKAAPAIEAPVADAPKAEVKFDEAAYEKSGVAKATMALNRAGGRDAVIALLADFGQQGDTPSARNIPPGEWAAYVAQAAKRSASSVDSSLV